jgi:hypothetical protein
LLYEVRCFITDKAGESLTRDSPFTPYLVFAPEDSAVKQPEWFPVADALPFGFEVTEEDDILINNISLPLEFLNTHMDVGCFLASRHLLETNVRFAHDPWGHSLRPPPVRAGNVNVQSTTPRRIKAE